MRDKERLHDYRFLPEPNLPPLHIYDNDTVPRGLTDDQVINVDSLREKLPELPPALRARLLNEHNVPIGISIILLVSLKVFKRVRV